MFIHDVIKINLSRAGYLPNYPPHLISDAEMCDAFLPYTYDESDPESGYAASMEVTLNYFRDQYPLVDKVLEPQYKTLIANIAYHLNQLKCTTDDSYKLPDWVYSYMLGAVLSPVSDIRDLHDLFVLLGTDNLYDEFDYACGLACYRESSYWLKKNSVSESDHRSPTIFGEPNVIKSLRLKDADLS